jgi:non-heme chloroperoxidase
MGGFVAQQVALAAPRRVSALVLMGTAVTPRNLNGLDEFEKAVKELSDPIPDAFAREFQMSTIQMPVSQAFVDRAVAESLKLPARVWRQLMVGLTTYEPAVDLGRAGIPTLVIHGLKDPWVPSEEADSLAALVGTKRIIKYPDAGHAMHWEQPAAVSRDVRAFLAEASGSNR